STVRCSYKPEATQTITVLVYAVDVAVVKDSTGNYHVDLDTSVSGGTWDWRWEGLVTNQAAKEGKFYVRPTDMTSSTPAPGGATYVNKIIGTAGQISVSPASGTGVVTLSLSGGGTGQF